jgi:Flp pilus assembly protein TadG
MTARDRYASGAARRFAGARSGIAAVEFALILPMLLALYFGVIVLAQGLEAGRKTQALSRTLADLASRQLPGQQTAGGCSATAYKSAPCFLDADLLNILGVAPQVMFPFAGPTSMTVSEIIFDNVSATDAQCCVARVVWSVGAGANPSLRACGPLTQSANGVNGAGLMPAALYPPTVANNANGPNQYLIVADVTYSFAPGFGFQNLAWSQSPNGGSGYVITHTTYMAPRNGALTPVIWANGGGISSTRFRDCTGGNYGPPFSTGQPGSYNVP